MIIRRKTKKMDRTPNGTKIISVGELAKAIKSADPAYDWWVLSYELMYDGDDAVIEIEFGRKPTEAELDEFSQNQWMCDSLDAVAWRKAVRVPQNAVGEFVAKLWDDIRPCDPDCSLCGRGLF